MRNFALVLASCGVGLMAGWGSAAFTKGDASTSERPKAVEKSTTVSKARKTSSPASRLDSVQACKEIINAATQEDGRHPLLRRFDYERALRRWIELDPQGALAEAEARSPSSFGGDLFKAWVELDPKAALAALQRSNRILISEVARDFFVALMARDPAMAAAELKQPPWKDGKHELLSWGFREGVARAWMKADPQAAIASLGPPGSLENPDGAQSAILVEWAKIDFAAAWKHQVKDGDIQQSIPYQVDGILAAGLLAGSKEALAIVASMTAGIDPAADHSIRPFMGAAQIMARADATAALEWAEARAADDPLAREVRAEVANNLASSDPLKALELLSESEGAGRDWQRDSVFRESFASLAAADPAKARQMISALEPAQRKVAMSGYLTRMFAEDEAGSIEQCRAWLVDPAMKEACPEAFAVAFSWGHGAGVRDPGPVLEAIPELNDAVDGYVLATWAKCDPEASAAWIADRLAAGKRVTELEEKGVLAELAISEPEFTAEWLTQLANPKIQENAAGILAANWVSFDPEAARGWIESLPEGKLREAVKLGMAGRDELRMRTDDPFAPQE